MPSSVQKGIYVIQLTGLHGMELIVNKPVFSTPLKVLMQADRSVRSPKHWGRLEGTSHNADRATFPVFSLECFFKYKISI